MEGAFQHWLILLKANGRTAMFEDDLSQGERATAPDETHLDQTKLVPQHTGIKR